jgi:chain length determinant protein EpsF
MDFQQLILILYARKRLILKVFAIVVFTVTVVSLIWPKTYTGISTVVVDVKAPDPVTGMLVQGMVMPSFLATQVDIITSERVSRRVVKMIHLDKNPEAVQSWKEATQGDYWWNSSGGDFDTYYATKLNKKLKAEPSRESNVIEIRFKADDPKRAAEIANAYVQAYLDTNLELMIEPAKKYTSWFTEQSNEIRDKMAKEQEAYYQFQKDKGIVSMDEKYDVEAAHLADLSAQMTQLLAQQAEAKTRQHEASTSGLEKIPEVLNSLDLQSMRTTIANAEGKLLLASNTLGANHPQVKEQEAELNTLKAQLQTAMNNVADSLKTNTQVSDQKVDEIRVQLNAQRKRMLDLKNQRDEANDLQATLAATQLDYNNIRQRLTQSSLQSQSPESNVTVLTTASAPIDPSMPKILLNILASILLGGALGCGAAVLKEKAERPIRSEADLAELGFPVLVVLTKGRKSPPRWQFWRSLKTQF